MSEQLPEQLQKFRAKMNEPSNDRSLDLKCRCGEKLWYLGVKYAIVKVAAIVDYDTDGEAILGDCKVNAPYAHWRCVNGHHETDGY